MPSDSSHARVTRVSIYVDEDCWLGSVHLMREVLAIAGTLQRGGRALHTQPMFEVQLVGPTRAPVVSFTGAPVRPDRGLRGAIAGEALIVPAFYFAEPTRAHVSTAFKRWIARAEQAGAIIVAVTGGVRLLAEAGVLEGREVACNPADGPALRKHYPGIVCRPETPLVIDGRIVTASSVNPAIDACAFLVSHFHGEKAATKLARYANSVQQPTYEHLALATAPWKQHADQRIRQAQGYIERQFRQDLSVSDVASRVAMSERNFARRFRAAAGVSPARYVTKCRIEHARQLLEFEHMPVLTVAMRCGFRDENAFRRSFRHLCGVSPSAYRAATGARR